MKGPAAERWLAGQGIAVPATPNTWTGLPDDDDSDFLAARLGTGEFFLEQSAGGTRLRGISDAAETASGVYPVLREDAAFLLSGDGCHEVLAQVCNVNFAALDLGPQPLVLTLMLGVSVLVVPQGVEARPQQTPDVDARRQYPQAVDARRRYKIWCDPTFGDFLGESLGMLVTECGGVYRGASA